MDDVLIFLDRSISDSSAFNTSLKLFCKAIDMEYNHVKSTLAVVGCSQYEIHYAHQRFPFSILAFEDGLKCLGFRLKPNRYKIVDWTWLVAKIERRLNIWRHRWISRAIRLVLIKFVWEAIPVYCMLLAWISRGILSRIQQLCCRFLWKGNKEGYTYAWVK